MTLLRTVGIAGLATLIAALSGCAGHKELTAPCANKDVAQAATNTLFSSVAYAAGAPCGPLVRQAGVSVF